MEKFFPRREGFGIQDVWRKMENIYSKRHARAIGVSNYNCLLLNDCLNYARVPPAVLQVERHPYLPIMSLLKLCQNNNVHLTAYAPLGSKGYRSHETEGKFKHVVDLMELDVIKDIAKKHGKSPSQVLLRWELDSKVSAVAKSVHADRIKENFDVFNFNLDGDDFQKISTLGELNLRFFAQDFTTFPIFD